PGRRRRVSVPALNDDFVDLLSSLLDARAEFLLVGAHAMAVHGVVRATGDLDVWVRPSAENAPRIVAALRAFGAPLDVHGGRVDDFARPDLVYQMGLPPRRIDVLTSISGISFDDAWSTHVETQVAQLRVPVLGRVALIQNKRATGRPKDELDV